MKVYISKSNSCKIDDLIRVRELVSDLGFKIIEHEGGRYNSELKNKADILIAIGHKNSFINNNQFVIGKGVGTEIIGMIHDYNKPAYIFNPGDSNFNLIRIAKGKNEFNYNYEIVDKDWQLSFFKFNFNNCINVTFASLDQEKADKDKSSTLLEKTHKPKSSLTSWFKRK